MELPGSCCVLLYHALEAGGWRWLGVAVDCDDFHAQCFRV